MRLIFLGPPGCGKGTQAVLLGERLNLETIGTGNILRQAVQLKTPAGCKAQPYIEKGFLAPDDIVNEIVAERFKNGPRLERFILDGYPRTYSQAVSFDQLLRQEFLDLTAVIHFFVPDDEIIRRLTGRWNCPNPECRSVYHASHFAAGAEKRCKKPECRQLLYQRSDDNEATVRERLTVYHQNTEDLVSYYRSQCKLRNVQGQGNEEEVYSNIIHALHIQGS